MRVERAPACGEGECTPLFDVANKACAGLFSPVKKSGKRVDQQWVIPLLDLNYFLMVSRSGKLLDNAEPRLAVPRGSR
jgi:hypothetical protein